MGSSLAAPAAEGDPGTAPYIYHPTYTVSSWYPVHQPGTYLSRPQSPRAKGYGASFPASTMPLSSLAGLEPRGNLIVF